MKNITIPLKLIRILSNGKIYSNKQLSQLLNFTQFDINKYIYTLNKWGIEVNNITNNHYQFKKKLIY